MAPTLDDVVPPISSPPGRPSRSGCRRERSIEGVLRNAFQDGTARAHPASPAWTRSPPSSPWSRSWRTERAGARASAGEPSPRPSSRVRSCGSCLRDLLEEKPDRDISPSRGRASGARAGRALDDGRGRLPRPVRCRRGAGKEAVARRSRRGVPCARPRTSTWQPEHGDELPTVLEHGAPGPRAQPARRDPQDALAASRRRSSRSRH